MREITNLHDITDDEELLIKLTYILNGSNRIKICALLFENLKTASDIKNELKISLSSVCRTLDGLKKYGIINCPNENFNGKKLYILNSDITILKPFLFKNLNKKNKIS